jgi:iron complex transport system substrate-binding protein
MAAPNGRKGMAMHASRTSSPGPNHLRRRFLALLAMSVALLAPATITATSSASTSRVAFPVTFESATGPVTLKAAPTRIVSLSPTATQILFAIGAGNQVIAADDDSTLPANAPRTSLSGYDPNVEAIAHYQPQLVVISYNPNGLAASLAKLGIPVLDQDAAVTLHGTYGQIGELGSVTGHRSTAQALIAKMRSQLATIVAAAPHFSPPLTYYYELDQTFYTVTSDTFVGSLMSMLGLHNIADAAPGAASGYPQLSDEFIVKADPKVIILADTVCCGQSAKTVAARPGWSSIAAVRTGGVVGVNDSIASQWGPNVVSLERDVETALSHLATTDHASDSNVRR